MKVLFAASEAMPLVKTGGLGDVIASLPHALAGLGADVRLLLPGYRTLLDKLDAVSIRAWLDVPAGFGTASVRVLEARHPAFAMPVWVADCPPLFDRPGNPYLDPNGQDWADNAERFAVFSRVAARLAVDGGGLGWRADAVHAHDWQTGLVPALLTLEPAPPRTVFTIHNLAYAGLFAHSDFVRLGLPSAWWTPEGVEFYGSFSMLKAGIVYADAVTTVSPTYAREIQTPESGFGLDGLLRAHAGKLSGILNGIDTRVWNPAADPLLPARYSAARIQPGKRRCKAALMAGFGAAADPAAPLAGFIGRLVEQKGIDWMLDAMPRLIAETDLRFVLLGSGQPRYEAALTEMAAAHPDRVQLTLGYDEARAHQIEAGADLFLMPSRFEPCGLNQLYSLAYGTPPVVFRTGGLADTVIDTTAQTLAEGSANGFVFSTPSAEALAETVLRALAWWRRPALWRRIQRTGMQRASGWQTAAEAYLALYSRRISTSDSTHAQP